MENNIENTNNRENTDEREQVTPAENVTHAENTASAGNAAGMPAYADVNVNVRKPKKISLVLSIFLIVLAVLVTFQTTYIIASVNYNAKLNEERGELAKYKDLFDMMDIFKENYIYDVDSDAINDALLHAYAYYSGDDYAIYYNAEEWADFSAKMSGNSVGIGVYIVQTDDGIEIVYVMQSSPAMEAGMKKGDVIVAIDGKRIADVGYNEAVSLVAGTAGTQVTLTVRRDGAEQDITVTRNNYEAQTVIANEYERDGKKIAHINITNFYSVTPKQFKAAVEAALADGCESLIFDVRGNPGGELSAVCSMLDYLLPEGPIVRIFGKKDNELVLEQTYKSDASEIDVPMVVLANENSASAAELFTSALRDYGKVTIVGANTFGKGCGQSGFGVGSGVLMVTSFLYAPPFSDNYDGKGIAPDIAVEIADEYKNRNLMTLNEDEDAQLKAALDEAYSKIK